MTGDGIIISSCDSGECNGEGPVGQDCPLCDAVISAKVKCVSCGTRTQVTELFPMEDAW